MTIYTGQLAYVIGSKRYYSATVTGGAVTWELSAEAPTVSIDDAIVSSGSMWSSQKTSTEINKNRTYSTDEIDTGKIWIDGKKIYRKVVNYGALPNNKEAKKEHNIQDINEIVSAKGITFLKDEGLFLPIPHSLDASGNIGLAVSKTQISIITYADRTGCINTYIILEYTKTTN